MKRFMYVLAAAMLSVSFAGCDKSGAESDNTEVTMPSGPVSYAQNDFALYTTNEDMEPVKFLCMLGLDASTISYEDENAKYVSEFIETQTLKVTMGDKENPGETIEQDQIRYITYKGSHEAVINVKGITTTGIVMDDDKCSTVDEVIAAYGIDKDNEGYIETEREDGSYAIRLNFTAEKEDGSVERIISEPGTELNVTDGKYSIRFNIINDRVHGIEYYMYY